MKIGTVGNSRVSLSKTFYIRADKKLHCDCNATYRRNSNCTGREWLLHKLIAATMQPIVHKPIMRHISSALAKHTSMSRRKTQFNSTAIPSSVGLRFLLCTGLKSTSDVYHTMFIIL